MVSPRSPRLPLDRPSPTDQFTTHRWVHGHAPQAELACGALSSRQSRQIVRSGLNEQIDGGDVHRSESPGVDRHTDLSLLLQPGSMNVAVQQPATIVDRARESATSAPAPPRSRSRPACRSRRTLPRRSGELRPPRTSLGRASSGHDCRRSAACAPADLGPA